MESQEAPKVPAAQIGPMMASTGEYYPTANNALHASMVSQATTEEEEEGTFVHPSTAINREEAVVV